MLWGKKTVASDDISRVRQSPPFLLLKALNDNQAKGREDATVMPGEAEARAAGLEFCSATYHSAMELLLDTETLVPDEEANAQMANVTCGPDYGFAFRITKTGFALLRSAEKE